MISALVDRYKLIIIGFYLILVSAAVYLLNFLQVEVSFNDFFPKHSTDVAVYQDIEARLGSDGQYLTIALRDGDTIYDSLFLNKAEYFVESCSQIEGVRSVSAITNLHYQKRTPFGFVSMPYLHSNAPDRYGADQKLIQRDRYLTQLYVSPDQRTLTVIAGLEEGLSLARVDSTIRRIDSVLDSLSFAESHLIGRKYLENQYSNLISSELLLSVILCMGVIILVLGWFYRSAVGLLLPLAAMVTALLILYGLLALLGRPLGIMANLFPTIVLIVGISDIIHLLNKYTIGISKGRPPREAMQSVIQELGVTLFLTSFTTAAGFLTLCTSSMKALQDFGLEAAAGVLIAYVVSITLAPAVLLKMNRPQIQKNTFWKHKWEAIFEKIYILGQRKQHHILIISGIMVLLACLGMLNMNTNNMLLTNIPRENRLYQDFLFFEREMGGSRHFELGLYTRDGSRLYESHNLEAIRQLHRFLEDSLSLRNLSSPVSWYHGISRVFNSGLAPLQLPERESDLERFVRLAEPMAKGMDWKLVSEDHTLGRFTARMEDRGRLGAKSLHAKIQTWIEANLDTARLQFRFSGSDLMIDKGHEHRVENMLTGLLIALGVVAIIIGIVFKNFLLIVITLIANLVPLILVGGIMGFSGIELGGTTSVIFTLGFVIAVDDSIHFLSKFRIERNKGADVQQAIKTTLKESGRAIVMTTIILFCGFLTLLHSKSWDIYILGVLVSLMLLTAVVIDLFLLPVLVSRMVKNRRDRKQ